MTKDILAWFWVLFFTAAIAITARAGYLVLSAPYEAVECSKCGSYEMYRNHTRLFKLKKGQSYAN